MQRHKLICNNQFSASSLKNLARSNKVYLLSRHKTAILKINKNKKEIDIQYWDDLASTINDLQLSYIVELELNNYWNRYSNNSVYEIPLELYFTTEPLIKEYWIDHA